MAGESWHEMARGTVESARRVEYGCGVELLRPREVV